MAKVRLFIDEDVHDRLAEALRRKGFDAINTREAGRKGLPDVEQLEFATAQGRAILSFNLVDYEALAKEFFHTGKRHAGIIVSPRRSFGEIFQRVVQLVEETGEVGLANQIVYL